MKKFPYNNEWCEELAQYIILGLWNIENYKVSKNNSISAIFLAWAPWAGKSEFLESFFSDLKQSFIIIDIDKYRVLFEWYNWENASEYQKFSVRVADKILKYCFKNDLNFIFDWTFRNYFKVEQNFNQCKTHNRNSLIVLIFQDPRVSYYYTFLRKLQKSRNVPIDVFIDWFYNSIKNSFEARRNFKNVTLWIAHKKYSIFDKNKFTYDVNVKVEGISNFCKEYHIAFRKGEFISKDKLMIDIQTYSDIMERQILWKWTMFWKVKMWLWEKIYKLF
jgi:hypothetical protein